MGPIYIWTIFVIYICSHKRNNGDRAWLPRSPVTGTGAARDSDAPRPPLPAANRRPILSRGEATASSDWPADGDGDGRLPLRWFAGSRSGTQDQPPPPRRRSPTRRATWRPRDSAGGPTCHWCTAPHGAELRWRGTRGSRFVCHRPPLHCRRAYLHSPLVRAMHPSGGPSYHPPLLSHTPTPLLRVPPFSPIGRWRVRWLRNYSFCSSNQLYQILLMLNFDIF